MKMKSLPIFLALAALLLHSLPARAFYDARQGRWLSRDPIGEIGGLNLHAVVDNNPINGIDIFGLDVASDECLKKSHAAMGKFLALTEKLKGNKCKIPKIDCRCCTKKSQENVGGELKGNKIIVCYNHLQTQDQYNTVIQHELIHAWQVCNKDKYNNICEQSICEEIEAYYNANCSNIADPDLRKQCVKDGVNSSSGPNCPLKGKKGTPDQAKVDELFEKFYDDCKEKHFD
jgi:hypothetical protein